MAIVYHGKQKSILDDLAQVQPVLAQAYRTVLGVDRYAKLEEVAGRVLNEQSYFENPAEVQVALGGKTGKLFTDKSPNRMIFLSTTPDKPLAPDGSVQFNKLRTAVAFYISDQAFANSGYKYTERPLASYIHEFNHFVWYALQDVPMNVVMLALDEALQPYGRADNPLSSFEAIYNAQLDPMKERQKIAVAGRAVALRNLFERSNNILDNLIMREIGVKVDLSWRKTPRTYLPFPMQTGVAAIPLEGDQFAELSDEEVIERGLRWQDHLGGERDPYFACMISSLTQIKVSRVSLDQFLALGDRSPKNPRK
jgi:hypothetical protein